MTKDDGKIYIVISDTRGGKGGPGTNPNISPDGRKEKEDRDNVLDSYIKHSFFNLVEVQSKQAVSYSIGNIGNFTGDYVKQQQVQDAVDLLSSVANIATAAFVGFKATGSPIGAVVAAGVSVIGQTLNTAGQLIAGYAENTRQNRYINQLRTRAGLNSSNNGSRGTEY